MIKIAIKFPKICDNIGLSYIDINNSKINLNINEWISELYKNNKWNHWIIYNDQTNNIDIERNTNGHCKGIFCWNNNSISWLIHSVPHFPSIFNENKIHNSELIYAQSFIYLEVEKTEKNLSELLNQLFNMKPHIYICHNFTDIIKKQKNLIKYEIKKYFIFQKLLIYILIFINTLLKNLVILVMLKLGLEEKSMKNLTMLLI